MLNKTCPHMEIKSKEKKRSKWKSKKAHPDYDISLRLWITGIPLNKKRKDLRRYFEKYCYIYISSFIKKRRRGKSCKIAEVGVGRMEDLEAILRESEHAFPCGSVMKVQRLGMRGKNAKAKVEQPREVVTNVTTSIIIKPIFTHFITSEKVNKLLEEKFGDVESCNIKRCLRNSLRIKCFNVYATFKDTESARKALEAKVIDIMGETAWIHPAGESPNNVHEQEKGIFSRTPKADNTSNINNKEAIKDILGEKELQEANNEGQIHQAEGHLPRPGNSSKSHSEPRKMIQNLTHSNLVVENKHRGTNFGVWGASHSTSINCCFNLYNTRVHVVKNSYQHMVGNMERYLDCRRTRANQMEQSVPCNPVRSRLAGILRSANVVNSNHHEGNLYISKERNE